MVDVAFAALVLSFPLLVMSVCAVFAYIDAPDHGMDARKWALISFAIPVFGFFAYLLERAERNRTAEDEQREEMFVDGPFRIHEDRADDTPLVTDEAPGPDDLEEYVEAENDERGQGSDRRR